MGWYGTDKPDLRFDLKIQDLTEVLRKCDFRLFSATAGTSQRIRGFRVPGGASLSRRELDELQDVARKAGGAGALWVKLGADGWSGQFAKAIDDARSDELRGSTGLVSGRPPRGRGRWFSGCSPPRGREPRRIHRRRSGR
jgi:aspartyl-tRNA synthetase